jgi:hypothetical protein
MSDDTYLKSRKQYSGAAPFFENFIKSTQNSIQMNAYLWSLTRY